MSDFSETTFKDIENDFHSIAQKIEAWFQRHFSHVTPGTPDHAVLTAAKDDLKVTLAAPASEPSQAPEPTA